MFALFYYFFMFSIIVTFDITTRGSRLKKARRKWYENNPEYKFSHIECNFIMRTQIRVFSQFFVP